MRWLQRYNRQVDLARERTASRKAEMARLQSGAMLQGEYYRQLGALQNPFSNGFQRYEANRQNWQR